MVDIKPVSAPLFQSVADTFAAKMARMDVEELAQQLDCSKKIAAENWRRYQSQRNRQQGRKARADTYGRIYRQAVCVLQHPDDRFRADDGARCDNGVKKILTKQKIHGI